MNPADFIGTVVPQGVRYAAWTDGKYSSGLPKFRHRHFQSNAAFADFILEKDSDLAGKQENVYFALAAFKVAKKEKTDQKTGNKYMACDRSRGNIAALRSFWIDLDCKPETYATRREAVAALVAAVKAGDLPAPTFIVGSGRGAHVYWCMDEDIDVETWQPLADGLKLRMAQLRIHIDPGVTIDGARILRLPGTHNRKDAANPLLVQILHVGAVWSRPNLEPYLAPLHGAPLPAAPASLAHNAPLPAAFAAAAAQAKGGDDLTAGIATRKNLPSLAPVVEQCAQLREMRDTGGAHCSEPLWMAALQIAAYADDGEAWAHTLSQGHPDYTPEETAAKFARRIEAKSVAGPTLCATFMQHNAPGCAGCPHYGAIRSPIVLKDVDTCLPSGYVSDSRGLFRELRDDYGNPSGVEKIASTVVHGGRVFFRHDAGYVLRARVKRLSTDYMETDVDVEAHNLVAGAGKAHSYLEKVIGLQPGMEKHMVNFVRSWTEELRRRRGAAMAHTSLGWSQDMSTFVFGDDVVSETPAPGGFVVDLPDGFLNSYHESGDVEEWKRAAAAIAGAASVSPELSVLLATSFGAPLMALTNEQGLVMVFHSSTSGVGKTKAMTAAAAVWGDPELVMFKHNDTPLSVERRLGVARSFPGLWDEVRPSKRDADGFKALVYHISGGREKTRLKSDAGMQSTGRWRTLLAMATNYDLLDIVASGEDSASPAMARMLPFHLTRVPPHSAGADAALAGLSYNYGGAGKLFMAYVVPRKATLSLKLAQVAEDLKRHVGSAVTESRFILAGCAAVLVGAAVAKKIGLVDFDLAAMKACIVAAIRSATHRQIAAQAAAAAVESDKRGSVLTLLPEMRDQWVVTTVEQTPNGPKTKTLLTPVFAGREPFWHVDMDAGAAFIRAEVLRREMTRRGMPVTALSDQVAAGVVQPCRHPFGKGTRFAYPAGNCYRVDLARAGMTRVVEAAFISSAG